MEGWTFRGIHKYGGLNMTILEWILTWVIVPLIGGFIGGFIGAVIARILNNKK